MVIGVIFRILVQHLEPLTDQPQEPSLKSLYLKMNLIKIHFKKP